MLQMQPTINVAHEKLKFHENRHWSPKAHFQNRPWVELTQFGWWPTLPTELKTFSLEANKDFLLHWLSLQDYMKDIVSRESSGNERYEIIQTEH